MTLYIKQATLFILLFSLKTFGQAGLRFSSKPEDTKFSILKTREPNFKGQKDFYIAPYSIEDLKGYVVFDKKNFSNIEGAIDMTQLYDKAFFNILQLGVSLNGNVLGKKTNCHSLKTGQSGQDSQLNTDATASSRSSSQNQGNSKSQYDCSERNRLGATFDFHLPLVSFDHKVFMTLFAGVGFNFQDDDYKKRDEIAYKRFLGVMKQYGFAFVTGDRNFHFRARMLDETSHGDKIYRIDTGVAVGGHLHLNFQYELHRDEIKNRHLMNAENRHQFSDTKELKVGLTIYPVKNSSFYIRPTASWTQTKEGFYNSVKEIVPNLKSVTPKLGVEVGARFQFGGPQQ